MNATPVAPLSPTVTTHCGTADCERSATWAIGPSERSCTAHLGDRLADLYRADPSPFVPHLPVPLRRGKW